MATLPNIQSGVEPPHSKQMAQRFAFNRPNDEREMDECMMDPTATELLQLNQRLLDSIAKADWATYQELCDPTLTAFEPEALGQLVEGMAFHRFYFNLCGVKGGHNTTMCSPHV